MLNKSAAMLQKSFKPAKCKTSLKLASSRIKLMRNKKEAYVKQLKRELAQLLESGQEQTARIRVEHVVREEKMMAAYDLLEIYCELIVARLPIIESQKACPVDLKEAVASVIFASPRCGDIPELIDVRKHFTAKYGKDFTSAAVELRPDCGVSWLLVEKLSAKAPDGQTKLKILTAIAEEHNIEWDPKAFGEKDLKPPIDLLNGPTTFMTASHVHVDRPTVQATPIIDSKLHSSVQSRPVPNQSHGVPQNYQSHGVPQSFYDQNERSHHPQSSATNVAESKSMSSVSSHSQGGPSGYGTDDEEFRNSYSRGGNASSLGKQNWNMEFKDATAAAQAAAESAERASIAARAAAELSSRGNMTRQYTTESQNSSAYGSRDESPQQYTGLRQHNEHLAKAPRDDTLPGRHPGMQYENFTSHEEDNQTSSADMISRDGLNRSGMSSKSASLKSSTGFVEDHRGSMDNFQMAGRGSQNDSYDFDPSERVHEVSTRKQSKEYVDEGHDTSENVHYFEDKRASRQSSLASYRSHSSTFADDHAVSDEMHGSLENPFCSDNKIYNDENTHKTVTHTNASTVFDDYGSDDDKYKFDIMSEHKEPEFDLGVSSPGRNSPFITTTFQSFGPSTYAEKRSNSQTHDSTVFSAEVTSSDVPAQSNNQQTVTYSEGPSSVSEGEQENSKLAGSSGQDAFTYQKNIHSQYSEPTQGSDYEFRSLSISSKPDKKFDHGDGTTSQSSLGCRNSQNDNRDSFDSLGENSFSGVPEITDDVHLKDTDLCTESTSESGNQLNFGTLTGGLRNKGSRRPPYTRSSAAVLSASKQSTEGTSSKVEESSPIVMDSVRSSVNTQRPGNQRFGTEGNKNTRYNSLSNDDPRDERSRQTFSSNEGPYGRKVVDEVQRPILREPTTYFDLDNSDSEEVVPKQTPARFARPNAGFSRRTKATPGSNQISDSKGPVLSGTSSTPDHALEKETFSGTSYSVESQPKQVSQVHATERRTASGSSYSSETQSQHDFQKSSSEGLRSSYSVENPPKQVSQVCATEMRFASGSSYSSETQSKHDSEKTSSEGLGSSNIIESPPKQVSRDRATERRFASGSSYSSERQTKHDSQKNSCEGLGSSYSVESPPKQVSQIRATERKTASGSFYSPETQPKHDAQKSSSEGLGSSVRPKYQAPTASKPVFEPKRSSWKESSKPSARQQVISESKKSSREDYFKPVVKESPSSSLSQTGTSGSPAASRTTSSSGGTPSGEKEKAPHVHPKLPDYDSFAAHFQALRKSRD